MATYEQAQEKHGGLSPFDAPVPGQSLTQDPEQKLPYEKPPTHTDQDTAVHDIFMRLTDEGNLDNVLNLMRKEVPVEQIAQVVLFGGFREGHYTPDLMLTLIEPTIYMLLALAESAGIEAVLYPEEDFNENEQAEMQSDEQAGQQIHQILKGGADKVPGGDQQQAETAASVLKGPAPKGVNPSMLHQLQKIGQQHQQATQNPQQQSGPGGNA